MHRELFDIPITREFTHLVGSLTGFLMPILLILSCSAFNLYFNAKGPFQGRLMLCCAQSSNFPKISDISPKYLIFSEECK